MTCHESENNLNQVLTSLDWSIDRLISEPIKKQCPLNTHHWVPCEQLDSYTRHQQYCSLRLRGHSKEAIKSMPSSVESTGIEELRASSTCDPLISWDVDMEAFSPARQKKLRMMEYESEDPQSVALLRDSKRRRQSYRGVHTARRSYTEVLREIIAEQSEQLNKTSLPVSQQTGSESESTPRITPMDPSHPSSPRRSEGNSYKSNRSDSDKRRSHQSPRRHSPLDSGVEQESRRHHRRRSKSPISSPRTPERKHKHRKKHEKSIKKHKHHRHRS